MIQIKLLSIILLLMTFFDSPDEEQKVPVAKSGQADFEVKGFHLDLRIQVMTAEALKAFAKQIAEFGLNTLVVEWEATYPYTDHATISNEFSYSREEVADFIAYCESLGIAVIPLQQSLGHVEYILRNSRYNHLKEDRKDISQLCPMKTEESEALFRDLFKDLAETHNSDYIHIGGDETYLLGHCELCSARVAEVGKSKLFVDHMKMIANLVIENGKIPVMWADIILKYPEAAAELPAETIFVDWNYGWKINHFGDVPKLQKLGFEFWGSPAIRSHPDNWYLTDWPTHFNNQKEFIPYARENKYQGIVMTSWSTSGLYGFTWDVGYDVAEMTQIRNTYPMSGFRILIACYAEAVARQEAINPQKFALQYGKERFGLTETEAMKLWVFLSYKPELISNGKPVRSKDIAEMKSTYEAVRNGILTLNPIKNEKEFAHFKLMTDLRMHYLDFKQIESVYNSDGFNQEMVSSLIDKMEAVLEDSKQLSARFSELNKGFLYDAEIQEQNRLRILPMQVLYSRLSKSK